MARSIAVARVNRPEPRKSPARTTTRTTTGKSRKITTRRTVPASPIARAVSQREAPKATRRFISVVAFFMVLALGVMFAVVAVQTHIAETQMRIDRLDAQIAQERARYDELRLERSSLREPGLLVEQAKAIGMIPGNGVKFTSVDPLTVAEVLVATGGVDPELLANAHDPLANYGAVKATIGSRP